MGSVIQRATGAFAPCQWGSRQLLRLEPRPRSRAVRITLAASAKYSARMIAGACLTMLAIAARRGWSGASGAGSSRLSTSRPLADFGRRQRHRVGSGLTRFRAETRTLGFRSRAKGGSGGCDHLERDDERVTSTTGTSRWGRRPLVASDHAADGEGEVLTHQRTNPVGATIRISLRSQLRV